MPNIRDLFEIEQVKDILILTPRGDVAGFLELDVHRQVQEIEKRIDSGETRHLLVDLGNSRYFGTVVIGILNSLARHVRECGGILVLSQVSEDMSQILRVMKLADTLPQFETRKTALHYLKKVEVSAIR
ncbi:MAG: STAS domain-containing protein [Planctomycetota bacterium]|nr:STAS domain-containing protein [Planctomycetota bacterium]MDA1211279.1 STAS domain-containing protein [Planctomycetota bacterium]